MPQMPWRLIRLSLILIFIGLLPFALSLVYLEAPTPERVLEFLFVPPNIRAWLVVYIGYQTVLFVGVVVLALAVVLVVRRLFQKQDRDRPISTSEVLLEEAEAIHSAEAGDLRRLAADFAKRSERQDDVGRDELSVVSPAVYRWLLDEVEPRERGRTALCLSGGGIRSASFALGVLQALAAYPRRSASENEQA